MIDAADSSNPSSPEFALIAAVHASRPPFFKENVRFSFQLGRGGQISLCKQDILYEAICLKPLWSLTALINVNIFFPSRGSSLWPRRPLRFFMVKAWVCVEYSFLLLLQNRRRRAKLLKA
jgi:hypothetical protein